jgi:uncharacterized protein YaiE (UPF0345 family)/heme-degrading monooxygenase HmoA
MIARVWHGRVRPRDAEEYVAYVRRTGLDDQRATPGHRGSTILRRDDENVTHVYVASLWESMDAVRRFAGDAPEIPVYYPEDEKYLFELEPLVHHYDVPVHDGVAGHRVYHGGNVQSLAFDTSVGPATVGVIRPGRYSFTTSQREHVRVVSGELRVRLPKQGWQHVGTSESYTVPAGVTFEVEADANAAYLCTFGP